MQVQAVVGLVVVRVEEVHVVGRDQADAQLPGQLDASGPDLRIVVLVPLDLDEEPLGPEDLQVALGHRPGRLHVAAMRRPPGPRLDAGGRADEPLVELGEHLLVDARPVVEPLRVSDARQLQQVLVAGEVLGQQDQVICGVGDGRLALVVPAAGGDIGLDPDDRLDPGGLRLGVELDGPEHIAVVRDGHRIHAQLLAPREQRLKLNRPVEQRVLAVQMEVRKSFICHSL